MNAPIRHNDRVKTSRVVHLEQQLATLEYDNALNAFDLVIHEMCREKGFKRHDGQHYYYHLIDVAQILLNFGIRDEDIITAALLHDLLEDVNWASAEYIRDTFGPRVAQIVGLLTKRPGVDYKADLTEMNRYIDAIGRSHEASLIKTADRIHNFSSMRTSSDEHRARQLKETRNIYIPFFKACRTKYVRYSNFFFFAKTTIEPILYEIERNLDMRRELEAKINELEHQLKGADTK